EVVDAKKAEEEARKKAEESAAELEKLQKTAGTHPDCLVTLDMATGYAEDHAFQEGKEGEMERTGDRYAATKVGEDKTARSAADFIRILQKALDDNLLKCCNSCIQNLNIYGHCFTGFGNKEMLTAEQLKQAQSKMCKGATITSYHCSGGSNRLFHKNGTNPDRQIPLILAGKGGTYGGWTGLVEWDKIPSLDGKRGVTPKGDYTSFWVDPGDTQESLTRKYGPKEASRRGR